MCFARFLVRWFVLLLISNSFDAMSAPRKRGPWESSLMKDGIQLADRTELSIEDGSSILSLCNFFASNLHEGSRGFTFLVWQTLKRCASLRTQAACAGILNGFQKDRCVQLGIQADRISQVVLTLSDDTSSVTEPRACTIINFAISNKLFVGKSDDIFDIELEEQDKCTVAFEMRKGDSDAAEWGSFSEPAAFKKYAEEIFERTGRAPKAFWHSVYKRDDYVVRKVVAPIACKDVLYPLSGQKSIQIKCVRSSGDPPEPGFDIIRLTKPQPFVLHKIWSAGMTQQGWQGAFASPYGVFLRFSDSHLAKAREHWLQDDIRFNQDNRGVKLSKQWKVQGFGPGTTMPDAQAALHSVGWNVVPLRCFQPNGLTVCVVASEQDPPQNKYLTNLGSLLISANVVNPKPRASRKEDQRFHAATAEKENVNSSSARSRPPLQEVKAPSDQVDPWANYANAALSKRVDALEKRMGGIEAEQKSTREVVDELRSSQETGFTSLLAAIKDLKQTHCSSAASSPILSPPMKQPRSS